MKISDKVRITDIKNRTVSDRNGAREKSIRFIGKQGIISHVSNEMDWVVKIGNDYVSVYEDEIEPV